MDLEQYTKQKERHDKKHRKNFSAAVKAGHINNVFQMDSRLRGRLLNSAAIAAVAATLIFAISSPYSPFSQAHPLWCYYLLALAHLLRAFGEGVLMWAFVKGLSSKRMKLEVFRRHSEQFMTLAVVVLVFAHLLLAVGRIVALPEGYYMFTSYVSLVAVTMCIIMAGDVCVFYNNSLLDVGLLLFLEMVTTLTILLLIPRYQHFFLWSFNKVIALGVIFALWHHLKKK
ncbi:MAG: hypothetical protein K6A98_07300 [Prevotella sp.]|nr:hypothetical protein [Prevotella sp.]MCR5152937.1 hypothetical protein [Prevotella sp.]